MRSYEKPKTCVRQTPKDTLQASDKVFVRLPFPQCDHSGACCVCQLCHTCWLEWHSTLVLAVWVLSIGHVQAPSRQCYRWVSGWMSGGPPDVADSSEVLGRSTKNRIQTWACGVPSTELHACFSVRTPVPHALCKVWKSQSPMEQVIPANAACGPPLFSLRESGGWGLEAELA